MLISGINLINRLYHRIKNGLQPDMSEFIELTDSLKEYSNKGLNISLKRTYEMLPKLNIWMAGLLDSSEGDEFSDRQIDYNLFVTDNTAIKSLLYVCF